MHICLVNSEGITDSKSYFEVYRQVVIASSRTRIVKSDICRQKSVGLI